MKVNPFTLLSVTLITMAVMMFAYSTIIYFIWNFGMAWMVGISTMPFTTALALGVLFYIITFAINAYKKKKRQAEMEAKVVDELKRFFDGEGK